MSIEDQIYFGGFAYRPTRSEVTKYMRGYCAYLALALHDVHGFQVVATAQHYATRNFSGHYVDIRGVMSPGDFMTGLSGEVSDSSRDDALNDLNTGEFKCGFFRTADLRAAVRMVKKLKLSGANPPSPEPHH